MTKFNFWRTIQKTIREECIIEASTLEEATKKHNEGEADYKETEEIESSIEDEGTDVLINEKEGV